MLVGGAVYDYPPSIPDTCLCWNYHTLEKPQQMIPF